MKAEERHRLQENDLERLTERARPFLERHGTTLLLALAAAIIVIAAIVYAVRAFAAPDDAGWTSLSSALRGDNRQAEKFAGVAEEFPDSPAAPWAMLLEGEAQLRSGLQSLYVDRDGALRDLADARKAFETTLDAAPKAAADSRPDLEVRAMFGLARTLEASSKGDLKPAIDRYSQVARDFPDTVFAKFAKERSEALARPGASAFYAWFAAQKAAPQDALGRPRDSGPRLPGLGGVNPFGGPDLGGPPTSDGATAPVEAPKPPAAARTDASAAETANAEPASKVEASDSALAKPAPPETPAPTTDSTP